LAAQAAAKGPNDPEVQRVYEQGFDLVSFSQNQEKIVPKKLTYSGNSLMQ
jgi:hypothetical protein